MTFAVYVPFSGGGDSHPGQAAPPHRNIQNEVKLIFEVIHKRRKKSSTIFCSQFQDDGWYERLGGGDNPISDAIMDRIQYDAYRINIVPSDPANDRSMREVYGIKSISDGK